MSVVGDFTVPAEAFALDQALSAVPEATVEADHLASHSPKEVFPFLWVTGGDSERFHDALKEDSTVTDTSVAEDTENETLYRMEWRDAFCTLIHEMVDHHAAILEAHAQADQWTLRLRFAEEEMVSSFQQHFRDHGHHFEVTQLYQPSNPRQRAFGLTEEQYEALVTAVDEGYFTIPRTASAADVSERLDISANAVSERIRRGSEALIRSGLMITDDTE